MTGIKRVVLVAVSLAGCFSACQRGEVRLNVASIGNPEYPARARGEGVQGIVTVGVEIGTNGHVIWARGSGADTVLIEAAERNAVTWVFGPFPAEYEFPVYHEISYVFKFKGHPVSVITEPCDVRTKLPDWIEISAPPVKSDNLFDIKPRPSK